MNPFYRRFSAMMGTAMAMAVIGVAGCQPSRPAPPDFRFQHGAAIIPRSDLFPNDDLLSGDNVLPEQTPAGDQAFNRNRRRDQKRRAQRREAGRNKTSRIGARTKQRSGGRKRGH